MIEENLNCLGHLSTIIHEANEEQGSSMMVSFIWIQVSVLGIWDVKGLTDLLPLSGIWDVYKEQISEEREMAFQK